MQLIKKMKPINVTEILTLLFFWANTHAFIICLRDVDYYLPIALMKKIPSDSLIPIIAVLYNCPYITVVYIICGVMLADCLISRFIEIVALIRNKNPRS